MAHKTCGSCGAAFDGEAAAEGLATHVESFHPRRAEEAGTPASPDTPKAARAPSGALAAMTALRARAKELGISGKGKKAELEAAIAEKEAELAGG